jgi:cobalt-zinc-cadmium efflux system membrane fusion protein
MIPRTVLILIVLAAWSLRAESEMLAISDAEMDLLEIEVQQVATASAGGADEFTLRAVFSPDGEWAIKTPLPGILHRAFIQVGDRVAEGDPLMIVRSPELVSLQRDYLKARAEFTLQQSVRERDVKLREAGSVSNRRWQETLYAYNTAKAEYSGLQAQLELAGFHQQDLQRLVREMEVTPDMTLRAPADAIVLERPGMLGDHLEGSELLARLGEPDKLILEGMLSFAAASHLAEGMEILMTGSGKSAVIVLVSSVIDPTTQTVRVRATPADESSLVAGRLSRWGVRADAGVLTVPSAAVVKLDGLDVAFVRVPGGFETRIVRVRGVSGGDWIVLEGLAADDRVAVSGTAALKGMSLGMGGGDG